MAARKKSSKTRTRTVYRTAPRRRRSSSGGGSKKMFGVSLPKPISQVLNNPYVKSAVAGAGIVSIIGSLISASGNAKAQEYWAKPVVRYGAAFLSGDVVGAGAVYLQENQMKKRMAATNTQTGSGIIAGGL